MQVQSAMSWPCVCNFLCLAVTALWYFEKVQWNFLLAMTSRYIYIYILRCACYCLLSPELWHNCLLMIKWLVWLCSKLMKNFEIWMSWGNPSTNQLTEKKQSKRKTPYRPLQRREPLKRKAGRKTEAQSVKRSTLKKKEHSQVSMKTKTTMTMNKKLGRRRPKKIPYKEPIRRDRCPTEYWKTITKKNWAEEAKETARESGTHRRKLPLRKNNRTMKKNLVKKLKRQTQSHKWKNM